MILLLLVLLYSHYDDDYCQAARTVRVAATLEPAAAVNLELPGQDFMSVRFRV